jgi:hypothetical protein
LFSSIGFSQGNDPVDIIAFRPDENHDTLVKKPDRYEPLFAIRMAFIQKRDSRRPFKDFVGAVHIETTRFKSPKPFHGVKINLHFCYYKKWRTSNIVVTGITQNELWRSNKVGFPAITPLPLE